MGTIQACCTPEGRVVHVRGFSPFEGHSSIISEGGLCLFAPAALPVGGVVDLLLTDPGSRVPIWVRGSIRNRSMYLYGIEFLFDSALGPIEVGRLCKVS